MGHEHSSRLSRKTKKVHAHPSQQEMNRPRHWPAVDSITPTTHWRAKNTVVTGHRKQKPPSQPTHFKAFSFLYQPPDTKDFCWKVQRSQTQKQLNHWTRQQRCLGLTENRSRKRHVSLQAPPWSADVTKQREIQRAPIKQAKWYLNDYNNCRFV